MPTTSQPDAAAPIPAEVPAPAGGATLPDAPTAAADDTGRLLDGALKLALAVALCAGASYGASRYAVRDLEADLAMRPPIIVMDFTRMATTLQGQPQAVIDAAMESANGNIRKLKSAGFVVLDGQSVLGAPDDAFVPAPVGKPVSSEAAAAGPASAGKAP